MGQAAADEAFFSGHPSRLWPREDRCKLLMYKELFNFVPVPNLPLIFPLIFPGPTARVGARGRRTCVRQGGVHRPLNDQVSGWTGSVKGTLRRSAPLTEPVQPLEGTLFTRAMDSQRWSWRRGLRPVEGAATASAAFFFLTNTYHGCLRSPQFLSPMGTFLKSLDKEGRNPCTGSCTGSAISATIPVSGWGNPGSRRIEDERVLNVT